MKAIAVGDLHGKRDWETIDPTACDRIIFLGDYVDAFVVPDGPMRENLENLIAFKKKFPEKVILLIGNHDLQYLEWPEPAFICSGFRPQMQTILTAIFQENRELFQVAYQIKNYLFTHAGLTKQFYEQNKRMFDFYYPDGGDFAHQLNAIQDHGLMKEKRKLHNVGYDRGGKGLGGITWVDKNEFNEKNLLPGIHQIVGHTPGIYGRRIASQDASIEFWDILDNYPTNFWVGEI